MTAIIGYPFGWVMWFFYQLVDNYMLALILFTLITKLILIPISIKQQKNTAKTALFQPKLEALKKSLEKSQQAEATNAEIEIERLEKEKQATENVPHDFFCKGKYDIYVNELDEAKALKKCGMFQAAIAVAISAWELGMKSTCDTSMLLKAFFIN